MSLFSRKPRFQPSGWGEPNDPDTRTQDVVARLAFEITRVQDVTEQLQDLVASIQSKGESA